MLGAAEAAAHEEDLNTSVSPALQRLQQLDTRRDADLFAIIRGCGFTELPAADPHVAMQERVKDKATQLVAQQDAKAVRTLHLSTTRCYARCRAQAAGGSVHLN